MADDRDQGDVADAGVMPQRRTTKMTMRPVTMRGDARRMTSHAARGNERLVDHVLRGRAGGRR